MTDDKGGNAVATQNIHQIANMSHPIVIKGRRRLVKQQHARPGKKGRGKGNQLSLPTRKVPPTAIYPRFISVLKVEDKLMRPGKLGGLNDIAHIRFAQPGNVFGNRTGKQERVLRQIPNLRADIATFNPGCLNLVKLDRSRSGQPDAHNQL